ncbi:MAG: YIP1 family protein [Cellulosilyticaceae bacterium]
MDLTKATLKSELMRRVEVYKLFFSKPKEAMKYIGEFEKLDTYQMLFTTVCFLMTSLIIGTGIFGLIGGVIGLFIGFFIEAGILFLIGLIAKAQTTYIKMVNLVMYTAMITAGAALFSRVTLVGWLIVTAASIYAFVLQVIGLIEIGRAEPKRVYITIGIFVGVLVLLMILVVIFVVTTSLLANFSFFDNIDIIRKLRYLFY